ncbi:spermidine synthase [Myxococcus llanfairpwllgwyngyllgogerychwyrndrobwllllantysiliogogogochensis]|uniref:Polyamine aminopropyltransferase n=1 Tax=Myxococcus llanfairpwllgwyngyllgogerychwyrndrobwllllantysiliogogogochensis TaxID=2590453 RepID=A0A540WZJ3_9BACT|nr:fused MFS/spermidine synthase [Myxococcus llanfairpwllgwyngyllgogerychwyrndrobwllllantysiliogogogochensis]TQF14438.1 spermidine synthase [Myxococcus llanfairpwllgwyngyllgogerychwyrndrobwllllantysiliogogogochensis]
MSLIARFPKNLVSALLFLSGGTALVYELVWSKYLGNVLGNSGQAHAVVLATFMGGLALGASVFGRTADRVKSPLALYGVLELGVALYALAFPYVLDALGALWLAVAPGVPEGWRVGPRLLVAAVSLVVPTLLMGGTLPALVRHFADSLSGVQRELARLYAVNSLGAALGVFIAGTKLVPVLGLSASAKLAAGLNLLLAVAALLLARRHPPALAPGQAAPVSESTANLAYPRVAVRAALVGVALSGFTSMLYQVTWIRLLSIVLGASTYAFTLILTAFILGIGLGSFWLMTRAQKSDPLKLYGQMQVALVASLCVALPLYVRLPHLFRSAQWMMTRSVDTWPLFQLLTFGFCCLVLLVPTFFMGAAFPAAARVATAKVSEVGRELGGVYLWNTVGTITGSALGGLVLMPWWGMEGNFVAGVVANLAAAALAFHALPGRPSSPVRALWPVGAVALLAAVVLGGMSGWSVRLSGIASIRSHQKPPESYAKLVEETEKNIHPIFYRDDTFATVMVADYPQDHLRFMKLNGKIDASNGSDVETQVIAGHLGALLHPREPKNVLLVGAGAAITAGSVLAHPVERLDMVEIAPAVIDAARLFKEDNRNAVDDPRTRVHIDDAKTFMALAERKYDLVVSVPSNPWVAGVSGLFTRDFFQTVDRHLADDGVLVQWIHTYESNDELIRLVVRTLRDTFPHATTWLGPHDLVLVASRKPLAFDAERLAQRMAVPEVRADMGRVGLTDVFALLSKQVHSEDGQLAFAGPGPINTDDHNLLEYASPIAFFVANIDVRVKDERRSPEGGSRLFLEDYLRQHPPTAEEAARLYRNMERYHAANDPLVRGVATLWRSVAPDSREATVALGKAALAQKDLTLAASLLEPEVAKGGREPELVAAYLKLVAERAWATRTVWTPVDAAPALALGRQVASEFPADAELARAVRNLCDALPASACAPSKTPVAAPVGP